MDMDDTLQLFVLFLYLFFSTLLLNHYSSCYCWLALHTYLYILALLSVHLILTGWFLSSSIASTKRRTTTKRMLLITEQIFCAWLNQTLLPLHLLAFWSRLHLETFVVPAKFSYQGRSSNKITNERRKGITDDALLIPQSISRATESAREASKTRRQSELYWKVNWWGRRDKKGENERTGQWTRIRKVQWYREIFQFQSYPDYVLLNNTVGGWRQGTTGVKIR